MFVCSSVTYDLENVGCPRPSCVQMCERSSKAQGFYRPVRGVTGRSGSSPWSSSGRRDLAEQKGRRDMWEICWAPVRNSEVKTGREKTLLGRRGGCKELVPFSGISQGIVSFPGARVASYSCLFLSTSLMPARL